MPPISSGGMPPSLQMLNILEGYDLAASGFGSAATVHLARRVDAASLRRPGALPRRPRAFNPQMPIDRLISKEYAAELRSSIRTGSGVDVVSGNLRLAVGGP